MSDRTHILASVLGIFAGIAPILVGMWTETPQSENSNSPQIFQMVFGSGIDRSGPQISGDLGEERARKEAAIVAGEVQAACQILRENAKTVEVNLPINGDTGLKNAQFMDDIDRLNPVSIIEFSSNLESRDSEEFFRALLALQAHHAEIFFDDVDRRIQMQASVSRFCDIAEAN